MSKPIDKSNIPERCRIQFSCCVKLVSYDSGKFQFHGPSELRPYFTAMALHHAGMQPSDEIDFFIREDIVQRVLSRQPWTRDISQLLTQGKNLGEIPPEELCGMMLTLFETVKYTGTSIDSMAGEVHTFMPPDNIPGPTFGYGYSEHRVPWNHEFSIPAVLIDQLVIFRATLDWREPGYN
ncbi:hypothetical protein KY320_04035 [Candidatus Woesearchaeota archaeon]|nr:hypothetical protein [Candidatus Woesearchaeota archaeon]